MALKKKPTRVRKTMRKPKMNSKTSISVKNGDKGQSFFPYLGFGVLFGYFLSKAGATDYDTVINMFRPGDVHIDKTPGGFAFHLDSLRLYGVIGMAIAVIALGFFLLDNSQKPTRSGKRLDWEPLSWDLDRLIGAFIFGAGWALTGTCPGTSLAQIGEGKLVAIFTVIGIVAGVWAYPKLKSGSSAKDQVC
jgi:uncharacterized membrane protein YedE/YeeE